MEYIKEMYGDEWEEYFELKNNFGAPPILKDEVRHATNRMKQGKAFGPDNIWVEIIESIEECGIETVTAPINDIYESERTPQDLLNSMFITLSKTPGALECKLHRTINLMSRASKILPRKMTLRVRNRIKIKGEVE